eukprot:6374410-Lingulodinium_polyedra.AAC.1
MTEQEDSESDSPEDYWSRRLAHHDEQQAAQPKQGEEGSGAASSKQPAAKSPSESSDDYNSWLVEHGYGFASEAASSTQN